MDSPWLHAVARYAGSGLLAANSQGSRTRPGYMLSPAARARACLRLNPRARGLGLGYMLSPATRARALLAAKSQGSRTRPGLHAVARCAGFTTVKNASGVITPLPQKPLSCDVLNNLCILLIDIRDVNRLTLNPDGLYGLQPDFRGPIGQTNIKGSLSQE